MALLVLTATLPNRVAVVIFWNHRGLSGGSHIIWLFGGSCGLTPRRRCRPGGGATRSEPVFPTKREGPAGGAAGTPWWLRRSCHLTQLASRFVLRLARRNSVHKSRRNPPRGHSSRSVYTPASPRLLARSSCRNSVHKSPETAPRGHFHRSVYTPASSPWR